MMGQMVGSTVERIEEHIGERTVEDILVCMAVGSKQAVDSKQVADSIQV